MSYNYTKKKTHYEFIKENIDIAAQRIKYIKQIQENRSQGKEIFYQNKT